MTNKEQQTIDDLLKCVKELKEENNKFREDVTIQVNKINEKVEKKELPLNLEKSVINTTNDCIRESLKKILSDSYSSPLKLYAENIIKKYQNDIESVFDGIVSTEIKKDDFKNEVKQAFMSKIARTLLSGIDGSIDKNINQMRQDSIFKSKLTLMINSLVDEYLKK
jgi:hypothetical protein